MFGDRFELGKVTEVPLTDEAVFMPGQAIDPDGKSEVSTVQFDALELTVKTLGKEICTEFSTPLSVFGVVVQTSPPDEVDVVCLSSLMYVEVRFPA